MSKTKEQTKKQSFIEASTNTAVGFVISLASTFIIFPLVGYESSSSKNFIVTLFFTAVSILRGYVIRRCFNKARPLVVAEPQTELNVCPNCQIFYATQSGLCEGCEPRIRNRPNTSSSIVD